MKKLSDYKGEEAIELWADLLEPMTNILGDQSLMGNVSGKPPLIIAKEVLENHSAEAIEIMLRIDPTPLDGMNILLRLVALLQDIWQNKDIVSFFKSAEQEKEEKESSGSATENTEGGLK